MKSLKYLLLIFVVIFLSTGCQKKSMGDDDMPSNNEIIASIMKVDDLKLTAGNKTYNLTEPGLKIYNEEKELINCIRGIYKKNPKTNCNDILNLIKELAHLGKIENPDKIAHRNNLKNIEFQAIILTYSYHLKKLMEEKTRISSIAEF